MHPVNTFARKQAVKLADMSSVSTRSLMPSDDDSENGTKSTVHKAENFQ